jgi:hypothetical protein
MEKEDGKPLALRVGGRPLAERVAYLANGLQQLHCSSNLHSAEVSACDRGWAGSLNWPGSP